MNILQNRENDKLTFVILGRVDTVTAPDFEKAVLEIPTDITELVLDLKDMEYTSSAGLRVILKAQKQMNKQGKMRIINVQSDIMDIFNMTGFSDILTIE